MTAPAQSVEKLTLGTAHPEDFSTLISPKSKTPSGESVESLTVGVMISDQSSLIWLAQDRGYFSAQGLDIKLKSCESGVVAVKDLLAGNVDLATAAETVFVHNMVERPDLRIIASMDRVEDEIELVARRDSGMTRISDLRDQRIGLLHEKLEHELFLISPHGNARYSFSGHPSSGSSSC